VEVAEIRDETVEPDFSGADIEVYSLNAPIDFDYSSADTDMIFKNEGRSMAGCHGFRDPDQSG